MSEWTRDQLWAEHDALHEWRMHTRVLAAYAVLLLLWTGIALFAYAVEVPLSAMRCSAGGL